MSAPSGVVPPPPDRPPGEPVITELRAGTVLRRVHGDYPANAFNPTPQPSLLSGGRFDSVDGSYAYTYLGVDDDAAIAETVCRDLPLGAGMRLVPRVRVRGRWITSVEVTRTLRGLVLHGPALAHVGAGLWLTKSDADQYLRTRAWAARLLSWFPDVDGFVYRCRHDEDRLSWVLFDDALSGRGRAAGALRALPDSVPLTDPPGLTRLLRVLANHNATIEP